MFCVKHALMVCTSVWNTVVSCINWSPWECDQGTWESGCLAPHTKAQIYTEVSSQAQSQSEPFGKQKNFMYLLGIK
jgi:hypothetical protein